ncbi:MULTISPECIES: RNA polymerase sigma factor [unclassified Paenibacillus]|uniref:RNA polymerase sigma factor n=1 Tax=unclassified Paenibacillus TaxID=185978 RepID=UPI002F3F7FBA
MKPIEQLYELHKQDIYQYLLSLTRNPTLSEDLLSETFISAIKSLSSFRGKSSIKTWLFTIARNKWLDHLRSKKHVISYNEQLERYVETSVESHYINAELQQRVGSLLEEKGERIKLVVEMRLEGYSFQEIAEKLQLSESSARVIDYRAKQWLRERLKKEGLV